MRSRLKHAALGLCLLAAAATGAGVDRAASGPPIRLVVAGLDSLPFVSHEARVTASTDSASDIRGTLDWRLRSPAGEIRSGRLPLFIPARSTIHVTFDYELMERGNYTVSLTANSGALALGRWDGNIRAEDPAELPMLFPDYYRQRVTVLGGHDVASSFAESGTASDGARRFAAAGPGVITCAVGGAPFSIPVNVIPRPAAPAPAIGVDSLSRLTAGGRPWFPLGIHAVPVTSERRRELKQAGFDLVETDLHSPDEMIQILDSLHAAGLRAAVPMGQLLQLAEGDTDRSIRDLTALVAAIGKHPALALWESEDEPAWSGRPAYGLAEGYARLRSLDPMHPISTLHAPRNTIRTLAWYNQATDVTGSDIYPVPEPQRHSDLPDSTLAVVGDETAKLIASVHGEKPVVMALQGFAWRTLDDPDDSAAVYPSFDQFRFMAYDAIVAGAAGLSWWMPECGVRRLTSWLDLKRLVSELRAIAPLLTAPGPPRPGTVRIEGVPGPVRFLERRLGSERALLVLNRSASSLTFMLDTGAGLPGRWHALFGDKPPVSRGAFLAIELPPWGVRVLSTNPRRNPVRMSFEAPPPRAAATAPSLSVDSTNVLRNPSFEVPDENGTGPRAWVIRDPTTGRLDPALARSGTRSLFMNSEGGPFHPIALQRRLHLDPGLKYELSAWVRGDTPPPNGLEERIRRLSTGGSPFQVRCYVEWVESGVFHNRFTPWLTPGPNWETVSISVPAVPRSVDDAYVVLQLDGRGHVWFDDVALRQLR